MYDEVGWIELISGPMFSGKTEELIRRIRRVQIARQPLQVFKPRIDDRYHRARIVSHSSLSADAITVDDTSDIALRIDSDARVVAIDEVQFFDDSVVDLAQRLANAGARVILAGLDQDFMGRPFGPMPKLFCVAEYVTKMLAICSRCGQPAGRSQRLSGGEASVQVGAAESYEARCRRCHSPRAEPITGDLFAR